MRVLSSMPRNRLRATESALALESELVGHFGNRDSLKLSAKYSVFDGELRSMVASIGQGTIWPQRSVLPGGNSETDQIAILSNYRPKSVGAIRSLLENIASYSVENGKRGGQ